VWQGDSTTADGSRPPLLGCAVVEGDRHGRSLRISCRIGRCTARAAAVAVVSLRDRCLARRFHGRAPAVPLRNPA